MKLMARAWADGLDFIGTNIHRPKNVKAGRVGFGDMICEVSNLCQAPYFNQGGTILVPDLHSAFNVFVSMLPCNMDKWTWEVNRSKFNKIKVQTKDWDSQNSLRTILHCHTEYDDYIKLDKNKFKKCEVLVDTDTEYATIQRKAFSKKCQYNDNHIKKMEDKYGMKIIEIGGHEKLGPEKCAYILDKAKLHIGIDSGMSHFALTVKDKQDVHIHVPKDRITSATYRWIDKGYNVTLI